MLVDWSTCGGYCRHNYHVNPSCSPTRASFMSGRHMIHHGVFGPFRGGDPAALDPAFTLLPQYGGKFGNTFFYPESPSV